MRGRSSLILIAGLLAGCGGSSTSTTVTLPGKDILVPTVVAITVPGPAPAPVTDTVTATLTIVQASSRPIDTDPGTVVGVPPNPKPNGLTFTGNGTKDIRVHVPKDGTLHWTNDGAYIGIMDLEDYAVSIVSQKHSGDSAIDAGTYKLHISGLGNWRSTIR